MKSSFLLALCFVSLTVFARAGESEDVQAQVRGFYHWYVHALEANASAEPDKTAEIHRYVSERFLKEIARLSKAEGGIEADPFLCAQDWDKAWEKNIRVKDVSAAGDKRNVQVELSGGQMESHRLNVTLVHESGAWKIDRVNDGDKR